MRGYLGVGGLLGFFPLPVDRTWDATENRGSPLSRYFMKLPECEEKNKMLIITFGNFLASVMGIY